MKAGSPRREVVLVVNPPQSEELAEDERIAYPEEHADWANYPCLGVLALASRASRVPGVRSVYVDGVVVDLQDILRFIDKEAPRVLVVAVSALSSNYRSALAILRRAKDVDPAIVTVVGNDHFTALSRNILQQRSDIIDYGFRGNEVVESFGQLVTDLAAGRDPKQAAELYGGLIFSFEGRVHEIRPVFEPIPVDIQYGLIDAHFQHSDTYARNLARSMGEPHGRLGVPVEIARGCIKFRGDNACTFCSIQYGSQWKNSLPSRSAYDVIDRACDAGYTDLYLTADELPLTFPALIRNLRTLQRPTGPRGSISAYARADGLALGDRAMAMKAIGIDVVRVGIDACPQESLLALNKPLRPRSAGNLAELNHQGVDQARRVGLRMRLSFVVGHFGQTPDLLEKGVRAATEFLAYAADVTHSVDVEILSPEPGSRDFAFLVDPHLASDFAERLGVRIAPAAARLAVARRWQPCDIVDSSAAAADYAKVMMPGIQTGDLRLARAQIRSAARALGLRVGGTS